jgi:hypothetical protein
VLVKLRKVRYFDVDTISDETAAGLQERNRNVMDAAGWK